jgi:hypothetical protein
MLILRFLCFIVLWCFDINDYKLSNTKLKVQPIIVYSMLDLLLIWNPSFLASLFFKQAYKLMSCIHLSMILIVWIKPCRQIVFILNSSCFYMNIMCLNIFHPLFYNIYQPNIWSSAWYVFNWWFILPIVFFTMISIWGVFDVGNFCWYFFWCGTNKCKCLFHKFLSTMILHLHYIS